MNDFHARPAADRLFAPTMGPAAAGHSVAALLQTVKDREYREMQQAFRAGGGLANSDEVTRLLGVRTEQPISVLARWIVAHEVVSFEWNSRTMLPLFQFDLPAMTLRPEVAVVIRELAHVLSDWEIGLWFARPNAWLGDAAPIDSLASDPRGVHDAARADRYLARG